MQWARAVMVPACREFELLPGCLESLANIPYQTIVVVVLNERADADSQVRQDNRQTRSWLLSHQHEQTKENEYLITFPNIDVLLVDHSSQGSVLGNKQGVGKARDIGMRRCIQLIEDGQVSCPWVWSTDADARFANDYLELPGHDIGVAILPYQHHPSPAALDIYDIGLRYYALGLLWAGCPYAFPTLGSVIVIHKSLYQQIHGFPDRLAAEDFYLLNKASKFAPLRYLRRNPVQLIGRPSDRVPFGTGRGMMEIAAKELQHNFYHPDCFRCIRDWIQVLYHATDDELIDKLRILAPQFPGLKKLARLTKQRVPPKQQIRRRHEFFDAFWYMKLIHHLRDYHFPSIPWQQALEQAAFIDTVATERKAIKRALEEREFSLFVEREFGLQRLAPVAL